MLRRIRYHDAALGTEAQNEAVATALMAQHRHDDAGEYYMYMTESGNPLPERTILSAARWGWTFAILLPATPSSQLSEQACIGAALSGNVSMLMDLHNAGVALDVVAHHDCPASAAARGGQVNILQLLQRSNVDLAERRPRIDSPLFEAAKSGHCAAAQFLLEAGAQPDTPDGESSTDLSPADIAAIVGNVSILRLFTQHTTTLRTSSTPAGNLRLALAIRYKQIDVVKFFVEAGVDINEADEEGQTAFHLAVDSECPNLIEAVIALGADIQQRDTRGQTAFERAVSCDNPISGWLAERICNPPLELKERKLLSAKQVLVLQRSTRVHQVAGRCGKSIWGGS